MKVHEVLEAAIEYVAMDGVLGTDPLSVQRHLESLDASVDTASFSHIYRLLSRHPSVMICISTIPLTLPDGSVQLGTAPLPADYVPPDPSRRTDIDFFALFDAGAKGVQMAKMLRGDEAYEDYMSGARARRDREEEGLGREQRRVLREKLLFERHGKGEDGTQIKGENGEVLFTILEDDDAALNRPGEEAVIKEDLAGMMQKWGSRLRMRCTDDEAYFRLTGTHTRLGKVSKPVLQTLQLSARSREKGITAIELGPLVNTSQGTMHYLMKVLIQLGLCSKLPTIQHGATTHLLVFHKFLEQNTSYRSMKQLPPLPATRPKRDTSTGDDDAEDDQTGNALGLDIDRSPLTEADLMSGIIPKQRLIQILDHPGLTNHLLRDKNLLELLGWTGPYSTRHRRSLLRHINSLAAAGIVERLLVGHRGVDCLRLTKHNPDYQKARSAAVAEEAPEGIIFFDPNAFSEPLNPLGGINSARSLENVVSQSIKEAGDAGLTHSQIRERNGMPYRRFIEFYVDRVASLWLPDHLGGYGVRELIENAGKERRLRVYDESAYHRHLEALGQATEESSVPPEQIGVFADISYRQFVGSAAEQHATLVELAEGKSIVRSRHTTAKKAPKNRSDNPADAYESRYAEGSIQIRGRPRKYLYVVTPTGTVDRRVIGQVLSREDLAPVWIYLQDDKVLVPAPIEFTGLGPVPPVTEEMMKLAKDPEWFAQFENANNAKQGGKKKTKQEKAKAKPAAKAKGKGKGKEEGADEVVVVEEDDGEVVAMGTPKAKVIGEENADTAATPTQTSTEAAGASEISAQPEEATPKGNKRKSRDVEVPVNNSKSRKTAESPARTAAVTPENPDVRRSGRPRASVPVYTAPAEDPFEEAMASGSPIAATELYAAVTENAPVLVDDSALTGPNKRALSPQADDDEAHKKRKMDATPAPSKLSSDRPSATPALPPVNSTAPSTIPPAPRFIVRIEPEAPSAQPRKALQAAEVRWRRTLATAPPARPRIDLGLVRRMNELIEALKEGGGILTDSRHIQVHKAWAERVAGTDAPHAPRAAYGMDRTVYKHAIARLEAQDRIKRTKAMLVFVAGRFSPQDVISLPEKTIDEVNAFCAALQVEASQATYQSRRDATKLEIEAQGFTRLAVAGPTAVVGAAKVRPLADNADRPGTARRNMLLRESHVGALLMGWQPGQQARARTLHIEMCRIARQNVSRNVIAASPSIVLLSLLLEDISVGTFFKCIWTSHYDEELDLWLHEGDNASIPLKDVPERYRSAAGFHSSSDRFKLKTLLGTLADLQVITPLVPCPSAQAELSADTVDPRSGRHFATAPAVGKATHLLLHSVAPLYHIADQPSRVLGSLPLGTADEVDTYWQRSQQVAVYMDFARIGPMQPITAAWPDIAKYSENITVPDERLRFLGMWARWQGDIRLLNQQNHAINALANQPELTLANVDMDQFAYENALPVAYVKSEIPRRRGMLAKRRARAAQQKLEAEEAFRKRHAAAQQTLRAKMQHRRDEIRRTWEARIQSIARDAGVEFSEQLVGFVNRRVVAMSKANITDKMIYEIVRLSIKQMGTEEDVQEQEDEMPMPMPLPLPMGKRKIKAPLTPAERLSRQNPGGFAEPAAPGKRRRFNWTPEMDELLIDAEAVIRARAVGRSQPGRKAMADLGAFKDVPYGTIRIRLSRLLRDPVREAYFHKLIKAWRAMWLEKRGTPELPDPDFTAVIDFPIKLHVDYMRTHIVKADISASVAPGNKQVNTSKIPDLPQTVEELLELHGWDYQVSKKAYMSVMWDNLAEEQRMTALLGSLFDSAEDVPPRPSINRESGMIRGMLKTIISTRNESYSRAPCVQQLERYDLEHEVNPELAAMMDAKQVNAQHTASQTGRFYSYSANWDSLTEGPIQPDVFDQASKLHGKIGNNPDGYDLPIIAEGGEFAELFQMVSDGSVELDVDIGKMSIVRKSKGTFNTRKMTDAGFEMPLKLRMVHVTPPIEHVAPDPQAVPPNLTLWALPPDSRVDQDLVQQIQAEVDAAGPNGVDKAELYSSDIDSISIDLALAKITSARPPVIFWAGYDTARIVSAKHAMAWVQPVSTVDGKPAASQEYCTPRRWVDMYGTLLQEDLDKCVRGAMAHIMTRPGLPEDTLRQRLSSVMDRQEATDVLSMLNKSGLAMRSWSRDLDRLLPPVEATGVSEEHQVVWRPIAAWCT